MEKILMNQIKAAGISFNSVSCEATFTGDKKLKTTEPTQKNPTSLTVSVAYKVVAIQKSSSSAAAAADPFLPTAPESVSPEAAAREEGRAKRMAFGQDAVPSAEGVGRLSADVTRYLLNYLNPTELAKMVVVGNGLKLTINNDPNLNNRIQHEKYLILAKKTADKISELRELDVDKKFKAYFAIATEQVKTNPEDANQIFRLAKQTADKIQDDYNKSKAYRAIATVQAKTNLEDANQTFRLAIETADQIQDDDWKSRAYFAIVTAQAKTDPENAKQTADQIPVVDEKLKAYCAIATEQVKTNPEDANEIFRLAKQTADQIECVNVKSELWHCDCTGKNKSCRRQTNRSSNSRR